MVPKLSNQLVFNSLRMVIIVRAQKVQDIVFEEERLTISIPVVLKMIDDNFDERNIPEPQPINYLMDLN